MNTKVLGNKKRVPIWEKRFFGFKRSRGLICIFLTCQIDKNWHPFQLAKIDAATTEALKDRLPPNFTGE